MRFRGGIAVVGGGEFLSNFSAGLVGVDGRLGIQINDLIAVYVQPHLVFGMGSISNGSGTSESGATGTFACTGVVDLTLFDHLFIGAGAGYGIVNNPSGPAFHARVGAYPFSSHSPFEPRRRGLMIGVDLRTYFTEIGAVEEAMLGIGYEAF